MTLSDWRKMMNDFDSNWQKGSYWQNVSNIEFQKTRCKNILVLIQTPCVILVTSHFRDGKECKLEGVLKWRAYIFLFVFTFPLNKSISPGWTCQLYIVGAVQTFLVLTHPPGQYYCAKRICNLLLLSERNVLYCVWRQSIGLSGLLCQKGFQFPLSIEKKMKNGEA